MTVYDDILAELRAMNTRLDQIAAHVTGEKTVQDLIMPTRRVWSCGHIHGSRDEAIACKRQAETPVYAEDGA